MKKLFFAFLILAAAACSRGYETTLDEKISLVDLSTSCLPPPPNEVADMRDAAPAVAERKIIKEGEIAFETSDPAKIRQAITDAVTAAGGYISTDNIYDYNEGLRHRMSVRVPSAAFDHMLATITAAAGKLDSKNIRARDVTEEFIDMEARVKTKKELEERYKELLKRATSVKDMLEVECELGKLRNEIESTEGRLKYLTDRVAMSALEINFYERGEEESRSGFGAKLGEAIHTGWNSLMDLIIDMINIWPFLLVIAAGIWLLCRWRRKRKARRGNA